MFRFFGFLFFYLSTIQQLAAYTTEGRVTDALSGEPLAFVSVVIKGTQQAAYTNIEGKFRISAEAPFTTLVFSYVGYRRQEVAVENGRLMLVKLEATEHLLSEVNIVAGENPAHRIIRQASRNRHLNNPEKIDSYRCIIYSKTNADMVPHPRQSADSLKTDSVSTKKTAAESDSVMAFALFKRLADESHLFMIESVYERKYLAPGNINETVLGTKASGLKHPSFSTSATALQPFSFYSDLFTMLDKDYLNPIATNSTAKYFFLLEDTLYQGADSVFIISFRPLKGKNFNGLQGLLYINTHGYAIQNVIASPYDKSLLELKIQQQYQLVAGKQWFPQQLNYELYFRNYPSKDMGLRLTGKSFVSEVELEPGLKKRDFGFATVVMSPEASFRDSAYWNLNRQDTLDAKEKLTYHLLDSLGEKQHFDRKLRILEALTTFQLPVSVFNIDLNRVISFNDYETARLGFGAHTNERLSRWFSIGGYAGYGFRDHVLKYGGDVKVYMKPNSKDYFVHYSYADDIAEPAFSTYFYSTYNLTRKFLAYRMDHVQQHELAFNFRAIKYLTANVALHQERRRPNYAYTFTETGDMPARQIFYMSEVRLKARYAYQEKLVQSFGQMLSSGSRYPILHLAYTKGFEVPGFGDYAYQKVSLGIEKTFSIRNFGRTNILAEGGLVEGSAPYPYLFHGNGSFTKGKNYLFVNHTFQTMGLYEFLSDRYAHVFLSHNFGSLLLKTEKFEPEIILSTAAGYGTLGDTLAHRDITYKTMEKGYFESGLMLNNLLRANYFNICYLGIGGGIYMRYGAYAFPKWQDNLAYKLSLTATF